MGIRPRRAAGAGRGRKGIRFTGEPDADTQAGVIIQDAQGANKGRENMKYIVRRGGPVVFTHAFDFDALALLALRKQHVLLCNQFTDEIHRCKELLVQKDPNLILRSSG